MIEASARMDGQEERRLRREESQRRDGSVVASEEPLQNVPYLHARSGHPASVDRVTLAVHVVLHALNIQPNVRTWEEHEVTTTKTHLAIAGQPTLGPPFHEEEGEHQDSLFAKGNICVARLTGRVIGVFRGFQEGEHGDEHVDGEAQFTVDVHTNESFDALESGGEKRKRDKRVREIPSEVKRTQCRLVMADAPPRKSHVT